MGKMRLYKVSTSMGGSVFVVSSPAKACDMVDDIALEGILIDGIERISNNVLIEGTPND